MNDFIFLTGLGLLLMCLLAWGFKHLPGERWQMLAVVPLKKDNGNNWLGANLTYYGFFIATSQLVSLVVLFILLKAMDISITGAVMATLAVLAFSLPASRLVAMIVEHKRHTFTIGGASFVGIIVAPWAIMLTAEFMGNNNSFFMPMIPLLAAMSIAYTLGEGLGRLGCISYGCCYGKQIEDCSRIMQLLFSRLNFIFYGDIKKVAYEAQMHGRKLVPIQAITCIIYTLGALIGTYLFLNGAFTQALLFTMMLTQLWRIVSETMRADFRGFSKISAYQKMVVLSVIYMLSVCYFVAAPPQVMPDIIHGLQVLWNPGVIIGLQILWLVFFVTFGRSTVTTSTVTFDLIKENI